MYVALGLSIFSQEEVGRLEIRKDRRMKVAKTTSYLVTFDDGRCFELEHEPCKCCITRYDCNNDVTVIGYLSHDPYMENPLDTTDVLGKIYDGRCKSLDRCHYLSALGYNADGDKIGDGNPYAVLLSVYSHSGEVWAVAGSSEESMFPDPQWDVSFSAGVWVPTEELMENIEYNVWASLLPERIDVHWANGDVELTMPDGKRRKGYKSFVSAAKAAARRLGIKPDRKMLEAKIRKECVEAAGHAVDVLNKWLMGDCWGVCVEAFKGEDSFYADDSWGFIDHADCERLMKSNVESLLNFLKKDGTINSYKKVQ